MYMKEIWKKVNEFPNYSVSNLGRIKSTPRNRTKGGILKQRPTTEGYLQVTLYKSGKQFTKTVHRLVALHFMENKQQLKCINHRDCNKRNNRIDNLEWCTHSQNSIHAIKNGNAPDNSGTKNGQSKINKRVAEEIRSLYSTGKLLQKEIANKFNISRRTVGNIINYDTWK